MPSAQAHRASWSTASSAVSCPYCSRVAAKSHRLVCPKRPMRCPQCRLETTAASMAAHQQGECPMRKSPCAGCGTVMLQTALQDHILSACTARSFTCATCGEVYWIAGEFIQHAIPRCERAVVPCQLCGHAVPTSTLAEHYQSCAAAMLEGIRPTNRGTRRTVDAPLDGGSAITNHGVVVPLSISPWRGGREPSHADDVDDGGASCSIPVAHARGAAARPFSAPATRRGFSPLRTSPARLREASRHGPLPPTDGTAPQPLPRTASVSPSRHAAHHSRPATASHASRAPSTVSPGLLHRRNSRDAPSTSAAHASGQHHLVEHAVPPIVHPAPFGDEHHHNSGTATQHQHPSQRHIQQHAGNDGTERKHPPLVSRTTHASALRVGAAMERIHGGPTSLAVKDRRRQALSDVIRRRENAERLLTQISHTPQLPSFVAQPLPAPASLESLRQRIAK